MAGMMACMAPVASRHPAATAANSTSFNLASLYEAFPPAEARRIVEKLEIHYTPKHGSWLNMAEMYVQGVSTGKVAAITGLRLPGCC